MTFRAICIGLLGAWALAYLTPWNDWAAGNSLVHGSYLPPVFLVALVILCGLINPRLGSHRLRPVEISTILALLLVVGSMASIGLMRHFPTILVEPSRTLNQSVNQAIWMGDQHSVSAYTVDQRQRAERIIAGHDRNGDKRLQDDERADLGLLLSHGDRNGDQGLDADELLQGLVEPFSQTSPVPGPLQIRDGTFDRHGSIADEQLTGGFISGLQGQATPPGTTFILSDDQGRNLRLVYTDGNAALQVLADGDAVADPGSDARAAELLSLPIGSTLTIAGKTMRIQQRIPPSIPWAAWLKGLLAWSPVILAMIAGALGISGVVRHQWTHNERLPMPIAQVLSSLIGNEQDVGAPAMLRSRGLWITAGVVVIIHGIRLLFQLGYSPLTIPLELDLTESFQHVFGPLDQSPDRWSLLTPHLHLTIIAMAFFMTTEVSGSLWGFFVAINLCAGAAIMQGATVTLSDLDHSAVGASAALCLMVIWVGRRHYAAALAAACGRSQTPEACQAAPWIWVLLGSCALLTVFMASTGIPLITAAAVTVIIFGSMLALARLVAETGTPYASFGRDGRISGIILSLFGPTCGAMALMPLLMIGFVVGLGDRERLLTHVLHGSTVHERSGGRPGDARLLIGIGTTCLGCALLAFVAMVSISHIWGSITVDNWPSNNWNWAITQGESLLNVPDAGQQASHRIWMIYAIGAAAFALMGIARLRWSKFPLNPIALIAIGGWVTKMAWASFLIGWLIKALVMRYGGQSLYRRLFPIAIGLILGEAIMVTLGMVLGLARAASGLVPLDMRILP